MRVYAFRFGSLVLASCLLLCENSATDDEEQREEQNSIPHEPNFDFESGEEGGKNAFYDSKTVRVLAKAADEYLGQALDKILLGQKATTLDEEEQQSFLSSFFSFDQRESEDDVRWRTKRQAQAQARTFAINPDLIYEVSEGEN